MNSEKLNRVKLVSIGLNTVYLNTVLKPDARRKSEPPVPEELALLLESGEPVLLETGDPILLEIQNVTRYGRIKD